MGEQTVLTDIDLSYVINNATIERKGEFCTVYLRGKSAPIFHNPRVDEIKAENKSEFEIKEEAYLIYMERIS